VRGVRIAVFGFSQVDELTEQWSATPQRAGIAMAFDENRAIGAVAAARLDSDLVVVMPHWGTEGRPCPTRHQQSFARKLAVAGADIIVGAHAHVLQGFDPARGRIRRVRARQLPLVQIRPVRAVQRPGRRPDAYRARRDRDEIRLHAHGGQRVRQAAAARRLACRAGPP
jgi:hypothetical protein